MDYNFCEELVSGRILCVWMSSYAIVKTLFFSNFDFLAPRSDDNAIPESMSSSFRLIAAVVGFLGFRFLYQSMYFDLWPVSPSLLFVLPVVVVVVVSLIRLKNPACK